MLKPVLLMLVVMAVFFARPFIGYMSPVTVAVYKAFAHLVVGGCFAAWLVYRDEAIKVSPLWRNDFELSARTFKILALGLTVWEVICFAAGKLL
jgi:hypothetical protein